MSLDLHIFMHDARIPSRESWQQAIEQLGFQTILDETLDVKQQTGFVPAIYAGHSTGFEFTLEPAEDVLSHYSHILNRVGDREMCATFKWGEALMEMAAALSAAATLTQFSDGIYYNPQDDVVYSAEEAVEATRRDLSST